MLAIAPVLLLHPNRRDVAVGRLRASRDLVYQTAAPHSHPAALSFAHCIFLAGCFDAIPLTVAAPAPLSSGSQTRFARGLWKSGSRSCGVSGMVGDTHWAIRRDCLCSDGIAQENALRLRWKPQSGCAGVAGLPYQADWNGVEPKVVEGQAGWMDESDDTVVAATAAGAGGSSS
jgi:hypothetical protein